MSRRHISVWNLLSRHLYGDWGDVCQEDWQANQLALNHGERIFSSYGAADDRDRLWVITDWDRSLTTVLRPDEY
jgi:hypothetical protein